MAREKMTVRRWVILAGLLMLAIVMTSTTLATTYYVSSSIGNDGWDGTAPEPIPPANPENGPWNTICQVNEQTFEPGDSIRFKRGDTWTGEQLIIQSSGSSGNPITLTAYGEGAKPVFNLNGADFHSIYIKEKDYIVIDSITIRNYGKHSPSFGIYIYYANHIVVQNCTIMGGNDAADKGIYIESTSDDIIVDNNDISLCHIGVDVAGSTRYHPSNVIIRNNRIHDMNKGNLSSTDGIHFYAGRDLTPIDYTGTVIEYNHIYNCADHHIDITYTKNITIRYNLCNGYVEKDREPMSYNTGVDENLQEKISSSTPRFKDNGDGTVTDLATGLMWTKNANLPGDTMLFHQALNYIEEMNKGKYPHYGFTDWRLPRLNELRSLLDLTNYTQKGHELPTGHPFENVQSLGFTPWSALSYLSTTEYPWFSSLYCRMVGHNVNSCFGYVWPVRGGK